MGVFSWNGGRRSAPADRFGAWLDNVYDNFIRSGGVGRRELDDLLNRLPFFFFHFFHSLLSVFTLFLFLSFFSFFISLFSLFCSFLFLSFLFSFFSFLLF